MKTLYATIILIVISFFGIAQNKESIFKEIRLGIEAPIQFSYLGTNTAVNFTASLNSHQIYFGPTVNLSSGFIPVDTQIGLNFGYRYTYLSGSKIASFVFLDL